MKVRLNFDHSHSYREWDAYPISPRGFYRVVSQVRLGSFAGKPSRHDVQRFEMILPETEITKIE